MVKYETQSKFPKFDLSVKMSRLAVRELILFLKYIIFWHIEIIPD